MRELVLDRPTGQLDQVLELVCVELQLTDTQYDAAERSYTTVGEWLGDPDGRLAIASPEVFAQGSMALGTTVKPREREEFDVDLVCLVEADWRLLSPVMLYDLVRDRLREHATYAKMLVEKDRCLRLDYAGQFHLDIIPACPAPKVGVDWGGLAIVIPDKRREQWIATNPRGFEEWFASRAMPAQLERVAMSVKPLPANLSRAVSYSGVSPMKRHTAPWRDSGHLRHLPAT